MTTDRRRSLLRLQTVARSVDARPIREDLVDAAFLRFRAAGELPEQTRLAEQVVGRALAAKAAPKRSYDEQIAHMLAMIEAFHRGELLEPPNRARECLYREAVFGEGVVRDAARIVLRWGAEAGFDVTDEAFLADEDLPEFGSLGLHLMGFPKRLLKAPFEVQGRRLLARLKKVGRRRQRDDATWWNQIQDPLAQFLRGGELPADASLREIVLVAAELETLVRHAAGHDVHELMLAFDAAARCPVPERQPALARLTALLRLDSER